MAKFNYNVNTVPQLFKIVADVFPEFSTTKDYKAGSYVIYNTMADDGTATYCGVYKANEALVAGAWDPAKWTAVEDGATLAEALLNFLDPDVVSEPFDPAKSYSYGDYVILDGELVYRDVNAAGARYWRPTNVGKELKRLNKVEIDLAPAYDPASTYNTGDLVTYNGALAKCIEDGVTGDFNPAKWTAVTVSGELTAIRGEIGDINAHTAQVEHDLAPAYNPVSTYNTGDLVTHEGGLYKAAEDGITGTWDASKWTATTVSGELSSAGADFTLIAANYAETGKSYVIGDFVLYNNKVFKATADHPAPAGAWTGTGWAETKVMDEVGGGGAAAVAPEYVAATSYTVGQVVTHDGLLYECTTATSGEAWTPAHWAEITMSGDLDAFVAAIGKLLGITCVRGYNASTHKVEYTLTLNM